MLFGLVVTWLEFAAVAKSAIGTGYQVKVQVVRLGGNATLDHERNYSDGNTTR